MTTPLDKPLRREVTVDGLAYTLTIDPDGFRLVEKGRRNGHELRWKDLLSGDAALAQGLYASLTATPAAKSAAKAKAKRSTHRPAPATPRSSAPVARRPSHRRRSR
nr:hypothetical protein [Panacagrimonas perspica]